MSESTSRGSSGAPRAINDAKIRAVAAEVSAIVFCLKAKAKDLHRAFDSLHDEIYLADPERDREFDRFLLAVAHTNNALTTLLELEERAKAMQRFGLSDLATASAPVQRQSFVPDAMIPPALEICRPA